MNPLLGVILLATGSRVLGKFHGTWEWRTLDPYGGMIITATLGMFILTLTWVRDHGVTDIRNLIGLAAVAGGVALLTVIERRQSNPLLHRNLWQSRGFILGVFGVLMAFARCHGVVFSAAVFSGAGLSLFAGHGGPDARGVAISNACMAFLGGYLADRLGNVLILRIGLGLICVGLGSLARPPARLPPSAWRGGCAIPAWAWGCFRRRTSTKLSRGWSRALWGWRPAPTAVLKNLGALMGVIVLVAALGWGSEAPVALKIRGLFRRRLLCKGFLAGSSPGDPEFPGQPAAPQERPGRRRGSGPHD